MIYEKEYEMTITEWNIEAVECDVCHKVIKAENLVDGDNITGQMAVVNYQLTDSDKTIEFDICPDCLLAFVEKHNIKPREAAPKCDSIPSDVEFLELNKETI